MYFLFSESVISNQGINSEKLKHVEKGVCKSLQQYISISSAIGLYSMNKFDNHL